MKKIVEKKKKQKLYKNYFPNANFSSVEKFQEKCSHLLFGKFFSHQSYLISFIYSSVHVVEMFHGIKQCVRVQLMMYLIKVLLIKLSIDQNYMISSLIGMFRSQKNMKIVFNWIEFIFNHNGYSIRLMHENYYQLIIIFQVILRKKFVDFLVWN